MSQTPVSPRRGMTVSKPGSFRGENRHHYYNQLIEVLGTLTDKDYGAGIVGYAYPTGKPVVVFSNPVPSERRKGFRNTKTMSDWVAGLNVTGSKYTFGNGAWVLVSDITTRNDVRTRTVRMEGRDVKADVLFCQWISCWKSTEQLSRDEKDQKEIFWGYGIARVFGGDERGPERVTFYVFEPKGPEHRLSTAEADYPVVFSFHKIEDLERFIDKESKEHHGVFSSYMTRVIDNETGKIVGKGEIIGCYDYRNPNARPYDIYLRGLAARLGLTTDGIAQLISDPDYTFQVYGLMEMLPGRYSSGDDQNPGETLSEKVLNNERFVRRDAPRQDGGSQCELVAVPAAFRGRLNTETGSFWLDKAQVIGYAGQNDDGTWSPESDIIPADSYNCEAPDPVTGNIRERGLDRIFPSFGEGEQKMEADSMRRLARALGCEVIIYPDYRFDLDTFEKSWDKRKKAAQPAQRQPEERPAPETYEARRPARRPAPQPAPEPEPEVDEPVQQAQPEQQPAREFNRVRARRPQGGQPEQPVGGSEDAGQAPQAQPRRRAMRTQGSEDRPAPDYSQPMDDGAPDFDDVPF